MGMLLSWVKVATPHLKTGRPDAPSSWLHCLPQRPTARAVRPASAPEVAIAYFQFTNLTRYNALS
jgi:hypothetical protein